MLRLPCNVALENFLVCTSGDKINKIRLAYAQFYQVERVIFYGFAPKVWIPYLSYFYRLCN